MQGDPRYKSDCNGTRLEQHIELADIKIEGLLTNETGKSEFFSITFFNPKMEASYLRILTKTQGYVTKSFTEDLTMESIILNITNQGVSELFDMSGNTEILQKVAQVWLAPIVDAIKNQYTYIEVLQQSEILSSAYIGEVFQEFVNQVKFILTYGNPEVRDGHRDCKFADDSLKDLRIAHYESLIDLNHTSSGHYTHLFHIKFKAQEIPKEHPIERSEGQNNSAAGEKGDKATGKIIELPTKEVSLKFEIDTNKFGEPLSVTKKYQVDIKLAADHVQSLLGNTVLRIQEWLSRRWTEPYQKIINDFFFKSTEE